MTVGAARRYWAATIACRVQYQFKSPKGPLRHTNTTTNSPTTTGGRPIPVFTIDSTSDRPGKRVRPSTVPSGIPLMTLSAVAAPLTTSEAPAASYTVGSSETIRWNASASPWRMSSIDGA